MLKLLGDAILGFQYMQLKETWDIDDVALIAIVVGGVGVGDGGGSHGSSGCVDSFIAFDRGPRSKLS